MAVLDTPVTVEERSKDDAAPIACGVLVLGGGPAGLCTAMMMASRGHMDIVMLERLPTDWYDPSKLISYGIDWRGKRALRHCGFPDLTAQGLTPDESPSIVIIESTGKTMNINLPTSFLPRSTDKEMMATLTSRYEMIQYLQRTIQEVHADSIKMCHAAKVTGVNIPKAAGEQLTVTTEGTGDSSACTWAPQLLIAADGARSIARTSLNEAFPGEGFEMNLLKEYAEKRRLLFKVFSFPPNPELKEEEYASDTNIVVLNGASVEGASPLRILMIPRTKGLLRTGEICQEPDHPIFAISDPHELHNYLEKAFPQVDIRKLLPLEEATRFVDARPGVFMHPQFCDSLQRVFPDAPSPAHLEGGFNGTEGSAVVLLGDAIHSFPPFLGQGVNAAMQDVDQLRVCLDAHAPDLSAALQAFQSVRVPESAALVRMHMYGNQLPVGNESVFKQIQRASWMANGILRVVLNKVAPSAFSLPAGMLLNLNAGTTYDKYSNMMRDADNTTRNMVALCVGMAAVVCATLKVALSGA